MEPNVFFKYPLMLFSYYIHRNNIFENEKNCKTNAPLNFNIRISKKIVYF